MAVLHSPAFSYPLPVLVRVLSNLLIFKGKILYYNKDSVSRVQRQIERIVFRILFLFEGYFLSLMQIEHFVELD